MLARLFDDRPEHARPKVLFCLGLLVAANLGAWAWAWLAFAGRPTLLGVAFLAWVLGLRHAFDADHIAAIDNVVRKLLQEGRAPWSAGLFFSLGHSSIVVLASLAIALTAHVAEARFAVLHEVGGVIGTAVSAAFLIGIGLANALVLRQVWAAFRRARRGEVVSEAEFAALAAGHGLLARLFRPLFRGVSRSWHLYPIGFLFGLGFDTATEVGLLGISASQASQGMSPWAILVFPALFTAGMSLLDTLDSVLMTRAYGWAFTNGLRKLWYNLTMTAASLAVALCIGGVEALGLLGEKLGLEGPFWAAVGSLNDDLADFGILVVGVFLASWLVSLLVYRVRGYHRLPLAS